MSLSNRCVACIFGSLALAGPLPVLASHVKILERYSEVDIALVGDDGARALYDALDLRAVHEPPVCPPEDACQPGYDVKTVSSGDVSFYCILYTDPPSQGASLCYLKGNFGPESVSFDLIGDAAATTAGAFDVLGNPYQSSDRFVTINCDSSAHCLIQVNAITEYWLDHGHFFFDQYQYYSYGRSVLYPFFVNDFAEVFYDALNVVEDVGTYYATKRLVAGRFDVTCYKSLNPHLVYTYRCTWDVPVPDGPLSWPVDVRSSLDDDAATRLYDALDLPGPTKEFHTGDGLYSDQDLYSIVCTASHCDLRIRRPPLN